MVQSAESGERAAGSNSAPAHSGAVLEAVRACLQISQHVFGCRCMWRYRLAVPHLDSHLLLCNRLHGGDINHANAYCRLMCSSRCIVLRLPTCNLITSSAIVTLIIRHTVSRTAEFSMRENRSWRKHVYTQNPRIRSMHYERAPCFERSRPVVAPLRCGPPDPGWLTSVSKRVDLNNGIFALGER